MKNNCISYLAYLIYVLMKANIKLNQNLIKRRDSNFKAI